MRVAKAKGHLHGRQPKLNPRQEAHLVELLRSGEYTTAELGDLFGVARSTVYRAVERSKRPKATARTIGQQAASPPQSALACDDVAGFGIKPTTRPRSTGRYIEHLACCPPRASETASRRARSTHPRRLNEQRHRSAHANPNTRFRAR